MEKDLLYLVDLTTVKLDEADGKKSSWIHALPLGEYTHPVFGKLNITPQKVKNFADSVKNKVRQVDPSINYTHQGDGEAAGWVKDAETRDTGLWVFVEWTTAAAQKIKEKAFRYFSAEYHDSWVDATGNAHSDVLFGGALTNRPFMKNLLPVNLSESSIGYAYELVEAINKAKEVSVEMDLKKLAETLGMPADSTEEAVLAKLAELKPEPPKVVDPAPKDGDKKVPQVPVVKLSEELKKLAEENPVIANLINTVDAQNKALGEFQAGLLEADIAKQLSEFDQSKIVLTPRAKDLVHDFLVEAPTMLHEKFWNILGLLRNSSGLMVELGERAGSTVKYGTAKNATDQFIDVCNQYAQTNKVTLGEAMDVVSRDQPQLYDGYRKDSYSFTD